MEVGCMPNKYWVKLYVKAHYMWYYIKHPKAWWKMRKIKDSNLRELMNLYIGRMNMIKMDGENDSSIEWSRFFTWITIIFGTGYIWYSIFFNGFFVTLMWVIVIAALMGICINMWNMRA